MSSPADHDLPARERELIDLVDQLDADNERLRMKALDLGELVEDAVTAQVAAERRVSELEHRLRGLEAELAALADSRVMRAARSFRSAFARLQSWRRSRHG